MRRIPPTLFTIAFGLAGLGQMWHAVGPLLGVPSAVPDAIFILAAAVWLVVLAAYLAQGVRQLLADVSDPVLAPLVSAALITPLLLGIALASVAMTAGRVVVAVFLAATIAFGAWLSGQWIARPLDQDAAHPGYFLATVAGALVGAHAAAAVHWHAVAEASFGIGIACWLLIGSTVLNRLLFRPALPAALTPMLAMELAPPVVAGVAWFALDGGRVDFVARALGGYAVLTALTQLCFVPLYVRLRFTPAFWAFTFTYATAAADAVLWITYTKPAGATGYAVAIVTLMTAFIAAIASRTIIAVARGQFLPASPAHSSTEQPLRERRPRDDRRQERERDRGHYQAQQQIRRRYGRAVHAAGRGQGPEALRRDRSARRLDLRETTLVLFGSPAAGTPVMAAAPLAALDLPLKVLIWNDAGQTKVSYTSPRELATRYDLSDDLAGRLAGIGPLTDALVAAGS